MTTAAKKLAEAIHEKCQRDGWFGPELDHPQYTSTQMVDPFFDDDGNPAVSIKAEQDFSAPSISPLQAGFAYAPATLAQIRHTEQLLGFALPTILKTLYQDLANGGFGPGGGLRGIEGGYSGPGTKGTLLDYYPTTPQPGQLFDLPPNQQGWFVLPEGRWPRQILSLADMGCVQTACVDAGSSRMYLLVVTAEDRHALEPLPWTLEEWLWRWVRGEDLLERYPPGAA